MINRKKTAAGIALIGMTLLSAAIVNFVANSEAEKRLDEKIKEVLVKNKIDSKKIRYEKIECNGFLASSCSVDNIVVNLPEKTINIKKATIYNPKESLIVQNCIKGEKFNFKYKFFDINVDEKQKNKFDIILKELTVAMKGQCKDSNNSYSWLNYNVSAISNANINVLIDVKTRDMDLSNLSLLKIPAASVIFSSDDFYSFFYRFYKVSAEEKSPDFANRQYFGINRGEMLSLEEFKKILKTTGSKNLKYIISRTDNPLEKKFYNKILSILNEKEKMITFEADQKKIGNLEYLPVLSVSEEIKYASSFSSLIFALERYYTISVN